MGKSRDRRLPLVQLFGFQPSDRSEPDLAQASRMWITKGRSPRIALSWLLSVGVGANVSQASERKERSDQVMVEVQRLRENAFSLLLEREKRVLRIAESLRVAGVAICKGKTRPVLGLITATERELISLNLAPGKPWGEATREVEILWVEPGYPAAEAGLVPGDVVVEVEGRAMRSSAGLYKRSNSKADTLHLLIKRNGEVHDFDVPHVRGCFAAASVVVNTGVGAYKDRNGIYVTSGMVRVMQDDSELAVVLGHEMGHYILGTGSRPNYESDADYIGLYLAARAGFDITVAPEVWRRWAVREPRILRMDDLRFYSHPRSAARALALEATIREIREKQAAGVPLSPEVPD